jgi:hypothetical protein
MSVPPKKAGRPKKAEVKPADGYESKGTLGKFLLGTCEIAPARRAEITADGGLRAIVASRIEGVLSKEGFAQRFGAAPAGGIKADLERVKCWIDWHPDPPARNLARAWEEGSSKRADFLSRWMLLHGTEKDRESLKQLCKGSLSTRERDNQYFLKHGVFPSPTLKPVSDVSYVLAMLVCGVKRPIGAGEEYGSLARRLGEVLAASKKRYEFTDLRTGENAVKKILLKLGFTSSCS